MSCIFNKISHCQFGEKRESLFAVDDLVLSAQINFNLCPPRQHFSNFFTIPSIPQERFKFFIATSIHIGDEIDTARINDITQKLLNVGLIILLKIA